MSDHENVVTRQVGDHQVVLTDTTAFIDGIQATLPREGVDVLYVLGRALAAEEKAEGEGEGEHVVDGDPELAHVTLRRDGIDVFVFSDGLIVNIEAGATDVAERLARIGIAGEDKS